MKIIFAQGNPEPKYASTRHNIGFAVLNTIADGLDAKWTEKSKFKAFIATAEINGEKIMLVKPTTYYNETGVTARKLIDFHKLDPSQDLLVIHDDLALPFGTIRVRSQGSDAGNNGIKSINAHIDQSYTRIRIGICNELRERVDDADFVLAKFSAEETDKLTDKVIPHAVKLTQDFCANQLDITSYKNIE